nr:breast cancer type 2 susceptibility protein-like isoform X2 [Megalopta genalis]
MPKIQGFQSVNGKNKNITTEAILEAKAILPDESSESYDSDPLLMKTLQKRENSTAFKIPKGQGFQTASGKNMIVTQEALLKAKALFSDETFENCDNNHSIMKSLDKHLDSTAFKMPTKQACQTVCYKNTNITEDALSKAKVLFSDETMQNYDTDPLLMKSLQKQPAPIALKGPRMQMFRTASGKNMNITEESLLKAKALFSDETFESCDSGPSLIKSVQEHENSTIFEMPKRQRFQSASGKNIHIKDKTLSEAKALPSDEVMQNRGSNSLLMKSLDKHHISTAFKVSKMQGFQTASGKNMNITEDALLKAKALFSDETFENCNNDSLLMESLQKKKDSTVYPMPKLQGFQTASGKDMNITEEALLKAKALFSDETFENCNNDSLLMESLQKKKDSTVYPMPKLQGFQTASGKDMNITEDALLKAKALFSDETFENCNNDSLLMESLQKKKDSTVYPMPKLQGFQTASGKDMNITEDALLKAKALFSDETFENCNNDSLLMESLQKKKDSTVYPMPKLQGFQTASGKDMNITEDALLKAKALFSDETFENCNNDSLLMESLQKKKDSTVYPMPKLQGFQTASGKDMNITEDALLKAKALFSDETFENCNNDSLLMESLQKKKDSTVYPMPKLQGFQTASGKDMNITEEALLKAKALFSDETFENCNNDSLLMESLQKKKDSTVYPMPKLQGFQTASGKDMNITEEALLKAKALFCDETMQICDSNPLLMKSLPKQEDSTAFPMPKMQGFQTASGKNMNITKDALLKAKALFSDDTFENCNSDSLLKESLQEHENTTVCEISKRPRFQTTRGKSMNVTEESLLKAKALFLDETSESYDKDSLMIKPLQRHKDSVKLEISNIEKFKTKALFPSETMQNCNSDPSLIKPLQKRKIKDLNDTSITRGRMSNQFKKLRFSNEFHVQKKDCKYSKISDEKENRQMSLVSAVILSSDKAADTNKLMDTNETDIDMDINSLISNEIVESAAALLEDENSSESFNQCIPPAETIENSDITNVPLSPVIGGQFVPKRRRTTRTRRKDANTVKSKESKSARGDNINKLNSEYKISDHTAKTEKSLIVDHKRCEPFIANDFGDTQLMLDFINESATILEKRLQAALEQEQQIKLKEKSKPKPTTGKLYFHRKVNHGNRITWREISKGAAPILCTYAELIQRKLPPEILDVTPDNAIAYKFRCSDFYGQSIVQNNVEGIQLEDGARLILDENDYVGILEIKRSFLASPGVDPNLLPNGWVENHYRWIVWKCASMDRIKFASIVLPRVLTPARVITELKYRYDREIDRCQRSAIRKILEKDDVASRRMILCVSSITEYDNPVDNTVNLNLLKPPTKKLTLTDGWYSVQAIVDHAMIQNIIQGKVKEGTKLITYGSELLHCDQGCSPLEVPENVCLKIHTNATRRARWDAKLGYAASPRPICIKLKNIFSYGGLIGQIKVTVARVYPILYHEKASSSESIFRNTRCEEKANIAYEKKCRSLIEAFYAKAEKYFSEENRISNSTSDSIDLAAIEWKKDREKLSEEKFLSNQERQQLINKCRMMEEMIRQKLESQLQESLPSPRQVTPVLKIRVIEEETSAILSIWSPNEDVVDIFKEGNCISICNVTPSLKRGNDLQLTAGRNTLFRRLSISDNLYPQRTYTSLCDINKPNYAPAYGEFDTVGIVIYIGNEPYGMKNFQAAYLAQPYTNSQSFYLSVLFWDGISSHGYAEILTIGSFIACSNLEWRRASSCSIPMTYCTERSSFTQNPRRNHLEQPFNELKHLVTDVSYVSKCAAEISEEVQKKPSRSSDQFTPDKEHLNKTPCNEDCNSTLKDVSRNTLLNHHSVKSAATKKRFDRLQRYGEASNLSPIVLNSSKRVSLDFQSPVRTSDVNQSKAKMSLSTKFSANSR